MNSNLNLFGMKQPLIIANMTIEEGLALVFGGLRFPSFWFHFLQRQSNI